MKTFHMVAFKDTWSAHQRRHWMRHDAHRWIRHDAQRYLQPGYTAQQVFLQPEGKANFNFSQPRVPKGNPDGGRWTDGNEGEPAEGNEADNVTDLGASRRSAPGFARPRGHHFVSKSVYRDLPLAPETRKVFDAETTGPLRAARHGWSTDHYQYNRAVKESLESFMRDNMIRPESMAPDQARNFINSIKRSSDPRSRDFNLKIFRRELHFLMRYGPRRPE